MPITDQLGPQEAWELMGGSFESYFKAMDEFLGTAIKNEPDKKVAASIGEFRSKMKLCGSAIGVLFTVYDEFHYETVSRSTEWKAVRAAIRALVSFGAAEAVDFTARLSATFFPLAGGIAVFAGPIISNMADNETKAILDAFEQELSLKFTHFNKNASETIGGDGFVSIVSDDLGSYIKTGSGGSRVHAGGGDDLVECGSGDDVVDGCDGWDTIYGGNGADSLKGGEGNDTVYGEGGADTLWGGEGDDVLWGDEGDDVVLGEAGADTLVGGAGSDELWGDEGNDVIHGGGSGESEDDSDTIHGGDGNDRITVGAGDHYVYGDAGSDTIEGSECSGIFEGGEGNDTITLRTTKDDQVIINGGGGNDKITTFDGDDHLYGDDGNDTLTGGAGADQLYGGEGNDTLKGGEGEDILDGGAGSDYLDGGMGSDNLKGGSGFDSYIADDGDTVSDSDGSGTVNLNGLQLQGGEAEGDEGDGGSNTVIEGKTYTGSSGETYVFSGGTLTVSGSGGTISIKNWRQGRLGITLRNKDDDDDDNSPPDRNADPLVLDLDGDGIETTSLEGNSVFFDIDGDGIRERTSWISADDGLLALDLDGDGKITSGRELFGEGVTYAGQGRGSLTGPYGLEIKYDNGFAELKQLDDNHDGMINANDAAYANLKVWRDLNADGETDLGELLSLEESGVVSISLRNSPASQSVNGNLLTSVSTYISQDGTQAQVGDVWLRFNQRDVEHTQPEEADASVAGLPEVMGSGRVRDLRAVMAEDAILKSSVEKLAGFSIADLAKVSALVEQIILRWCGVTDGIATDFSRGAFVNGGQLAALEAWNDTPFLQNNLPSPRVDAGAILSEQWDLLHRNIAVRLIAQTPLGQQLFPEIQLVGGDFLSFTTQPTSSEMLARLQANQPSGMLERVAYWHAGLRVLDTVYGSFPDVNEATYRANVENLLKSQGIDLGYYALITARVGGEAGDGITTQSQGGGIYSSVNADAATRAPCVVVGGPGDDNIRLGAGKQIVYYGRAQGNDLVQLGLNSLSHVEVRLADLGMHDVSFGRSATNAADLVITVLATGETLTLTNAFSVWAAAEGSIVFDDGTTWPLSEVTVPGALRGGIGSDVLVQTAGASELNGGVGDDILIGNADNTTYVFERGSGHDLIKDAGYDNIVRFGPGIAFDDLLFFTDDSDFSKLYVRIAGTDDILQIGSQFSGWKQTISRFEFADGGEAFVPPADFQAALIAEFYTLRGTAASDLLRVERSGDFHLLGLGGNDSLSGGSGNDTLEGGDGNDQLSGGVGDDTFIGGAGDDVIKDSPGGDIVENNAGTDTILYARGDGNDRIINYSSTGNSDRLVLQGINPADVFLSLSANGQDIIVNVPDGSVTLQAQRYQRVWQAVGEIQFADGTVWDRLEILAHLFPENGATVNLTGTAGDDVLVGTAADEVIQGGAGNDSLSGKAGSDTYVFGVGSGNDEITEAGTNDVLSIDRIHLIDLAPADVEMRRFAGTGDLTIRILSTGETLTVKEQNYGSEKAIEQILFDDGTVLAGSGILERSILSGTQGNDSLYGIGTGETIDGGGGNDYMAGSGGSDTYLWRVGAGSDTISDTAKTGSSENEVRLQGLSVVDLSFARNTAGDLLVTIIASGETLRISNQFSYNWSQRYGVDRLVFDDGTVLDRPALMALAPIMGTDGNDSLTGTYGADVMDGGLGDDVLKGNGGGDTYIWRPGDGNDIITPGATTDVLRLHGVTRSDLIFSRDPSDATNLKIVIASTGETLTIRQQFGYSWGRAINSIVFDDGTVIDREQLSEMAPLVGTAGNDVIEGTYGADVIIGCAGDDTLSGGDGIDTYVWRQGDGNDTILPGEGGILRLDGVMAEDVHFSRQPGNSSTLLITIVTTGEIITVEDQFSSNYDGLDRIVFGDGSEMILEDLGHDLPYLGDTGIDTIYGDGFANTLNGGVGNDTLIGDQGGDLYLWRPGDGDDTIVEGIYGYGEGGPTPQLLSYGYGYNYGEGWDDPDTLRLSGVTRDDLTFARDEFNLLVRIGSTNETITIAGYYFSDQYQVEQIVLDDGLVIDLTAIATSLGLAATAGDDTLIGGSSDDTLDGGGGDDLLVGGLGNDSYVVGHTSDDETVYESGGDADAIRFADGIAPESVAFRRDGDDLIAEIGGVTRGAVTIKGQFSGDDVNRVEEFRFGDGTVIGWQEIEAYLLDQNCTNGNDTILDYAGDDVINARGGDDTIIAGFGDDIIIGGAGRDTVVFSGRRSEYTVEVVDGRTVVTDKSYYDRDGTDILIGVENLQFAPNAGTTTPVTVSLVANTAPVAGEAAFAGREDHVLKLQAADLLAHASDPDGDSLRLVSVSDAVGGTVALVNGVVTFTPTADFTGEASFSYTVTDSAGATSMAVAKVAVAAVNDAPVSAGVLANMASAEDAPFRYTLPAGVFTDVDGDVLVLSATLADGNALPSWLSFDPASATFSGTPPQDFNGGLSVRVSASDGSATAEQTFDITITAVNDAPVVTGAMAEMSVRADDVLIQSLPTDLFSDVDGDLLSYTVTLSDGMPLPTWLSFDPDSRALYGFPDRADVGTLTLRVTAADGSTSTSTEFTLTVNPGNTAPVVATPLADVASVEDAAISFTIPAGTFADAEGDALALTATLSDGSPLPSWLAFDATAGTFSGQPPADFNGALAVKVTASDGTYTAASSFALTVTPVNDAPIVVVPLTDVVSAEDTAIAFTIPVGAFADVDDSALVLTATLVDGSPLPVWLAFDTDTGAFSGQPPADFNGTLVVTVTASDGDYTASSSFTLAVTAVNDAPIVAAPLTVTTDEDAVLIAIDLLAGASDVDGDALSVANVQQTGGRNVAFTVANGTLNMTPGQWNDLAEGLSEQLVFAYAITDGTIAVEQMVTVTVTGCNDRPVATDITFTAPADHSTGFALMATDADAGARLTYALVGAPAPGVIAVGTDGVVSFDPQGQFRSLAEGESADVAFTWTVTDEHGATSEVHTATITVTGVNDGPSAADDSFDALSGQQLVLSAADLLGNDSDPDHDAVLRLVSVAGATHGAVTILADGSVVFTAERTFVGEASFDYVVADEHGATAIGHVVVTVAPSDITFVAGPCPEDFVGGPGTNTVNYENSGLPVWVDLSSGHGWLGACGDTYSNIQNVVGSRYADMLIGDAQDNVLTGGGGGDILYGGDGNDTVSYATSAGGVDVDLRQHSGRRYDAQCDTLWDIENVEGSSYDDRLYGDSGANTLIGGDGDDTLSGDAGDDVMIGGRGDDCYYVDNLSDVVSEAANEGIDTVRSSVSITLGDNLENLTLVCASAVIGTGNALDNTIIGNSARNTLYGGAGNDILDGGGNADLMVGGTGDDVYVVDNASDVVRETVDQGVDSVRSSISYTLGSDVENLTLTGSGNLSGTGNALDNIVIGNAGRNSLYGGAGDDTLDGGGGNDVLQGGTGNDTYLFGRHRGRDTISESDTTAGNVDTIRFGDGIAADQLWFQRKGGDLVVSIIGTSDSIAIRNWYTNSGSHAERFETADGHVLLDTQVNNLVNAMACFSAPRAGQTELPRVLENQLEPVIAANWH